MPENQQPPLQPSPPQQPPPDQNNQPEKKPVDPRFQNYSNLRQKIQSEFIGRYKEELTRDLEENLADRDTLLLQNPENQALKDHTTNLQNTLRFFTDQIENASFILAQRTIKLLPQQIMITRAHIKDALIEAQNELTQNELWFDAILPSRGKRKKIADSISNSFDLATSPQRQIIQKAIEEQEQYAESFKVNQAPTQEEIFDQIHQAAQKEGLSEKKSQKVAKETTDILESKALIHGAEIPEKQQISIIEHIVEVHGGIKEPVKAKKIAENIHQKTKTGLKLHLDTLGNKRFKILKNEGLIGNILNIANEYGKFTRVNKVRKFFKSIRHPVRTVTGKIFQPVITRIGRAATKPFRFLAAKTISAVTKGLIKIGLGGVVSKLSSVALASTGVGVPLTLVKEGAFGILGTSIGLVKDWIKTLTSISLSQPLQTAKRLGGTIIDTTGAVVGSGVGAVAGAIGGTIGGAIAGFFAGGIGAIPGAILGLSSGTIFGAGMGASFGYKLRKRLKKSLALLLALKILGKELLLAAADALTFAIPGAILGAKAGAALGALICSPIGPLAVICSGVGGIVGGAVGGISGAIIGLKLKPVTTIINLYSQAKEIVALTQEKGIGSLFKATGEGFSGGAGGGFESLKQAVSKAFTAAKEGITSAATEAYSGIQSGLSTTATSVQTGLSAAFRGFVNPFRKLFGLERLTPPIPELTAPITKPLPEIPTAPITKPVADAVSTAAKQGLSKVARSINRATGITGHQAQQIAYRTESVLHAITTATVPNWLAASPLMALGLIGAFALITYTVLLTAFYVHPTQVDPYAYDAYRGVPGSRFIQVQKTAQATVNGTNFGPSSQLTLPNPNDPFTITYTIRVTAVDNDLSNITITDNYSASGANNPPTPGSQTWNLDSLTDGNTWTQTVSLNIPIIGSDLVQWHDALLLNTVTVSASVNSRIEQSTATNNITIGQPPSCPPSGSPLMGYYISGYRYTNNGISCIADGVSHPGIDVSSSNYNVFTTFNCPAQVAYVGNRGAGFGNWVALRSGSWYTFYGHLNNALVSVGQTVNPGDVIGIMNASGYSDGDHVHYEIRQDPGVNPADDCQPPQAVDPCNFGIAC